MSRKIQIAFLYFTCLGLVSCSGQKPRKQTQVLSDDFDKSIPFYYGMPDKLTASDISPAFEQEGQQILLTGKVYKADGKTPAPDVILYYYQTNTNGIYPVDEREERNMPKNKLGQSHGYIRGWLKTDKQGKYSIHTIKPGSYPSRDEPAHIHVTVKEQNVVAPYYIDDFVFDDDRLLTSERRRNMENRGGSGVIRFVYKDEMVIGERNIILGLNIPDYPKQASNLMNSGKAIGEDVISFTPYHAYGADKGSKTCPICKYGWYHGILYFVGNKPDWSEIKRWLTFLDQESLARNEYLKVYFVYGNEVNYNKAHRIQLLERLGNELDLQQVALTFVPSFFDKGSEVYLNKIDQNVQNTFLLYKRSNIIDKFVDMKPNQANFSKLTKRLDETTNEYFKLSGVPSLNRLPDLIKK